MKKIKFLHTAEVHVQTFTELTKSYNVDVEHVVLPELLSRAQQNGLGDVRAETLKVLKNLSDANAVVCTCSTLGPIVDEISYIYPHILRIDKPLMRAAVEFAPNIAVAICLQSTEASTLNLLQECARDAGVKIKPQLILCADAWQFFETGNMPAFAQSIAAQIARELRPNTGCVILAQASMRVATPLLQSLNIPILSSPKLVVDAAVEILNSAKKTPNS